MAEWNPFSPFKRGGKPPKAQAPSLTLSPSPSKEPASVLDPLAAQIGAFLREHVTAKDLGRLSRETGLPRATIARAASGLSLKVETLEALARGLGWTLELRDGEGRVIAKL